MIFKSIVKVTSSISALTGVIKYQYLRDVKGSLKVLRSSPFVESKLAKSDFLEDSNLGPLPAGV